MRTRVSPRPSKSQRSAMVRDRHGNKVGRRIFGVVDFCIHGPSRSASKPKRAKITPSMMIGLVDSGLPFGELNALRASLDVPMERLTPKLGISKATLHRRKAAGRLGRDESDRVVRFARLMGKALDVFESEELARSWLNSPQVGLGGAVPLDYAETELGAREAEDLLSRIEYGVYS